jgi:hypothetical protein
MLGQDVVPTEEIRKRSDLQKPLLNSIRNHEPPSDAVKDGRSRESLKNLSIESFGFSAAQTGPRYEFPGAMSAGPFTSHGLECPRCIIRPSMERMRYTLPAFGTFATVKLMSGRAELFTGMGGVNAWKPENSIIYVDSQGFRRNSSFNDAWLVQGLAGARVAVDKDRQFWLGGAARYMQNYGAGPKHWNSLGGSATFRFGK